MSSIFSERNLSRVGMRAQSIPLCHEVFHQSWRRTFFASRVSRRSTSKTRMPASYWARKLSTQLGVVSPPMEPMPWATSWELDRISAADSSPAGLVFSWTAGSSASSASWSDSEGSLAEGRTETLSCDTASGWSIGCSHRRSSASAGGATVSARS